MDYSNPQLAERLAAEYVLGTLRGGARRRMEQLLPAHPALAAAVRTWEVRVSALATPVPPVPPSAAVWKQLQVRLFNGGRAPLPWWARLNIWRSISGLAVGTAAAAVFMAVQAPAPGAPVLVLMSGTEAGTPLVRTGFVASVNATGTALVVKPLGDVALQGDRVLELWAVKGAGGPRSLGLVSANAATTLLKPEILKGTSALALSLEPKGGSPTGAPTGPIVSVGAV